LRLRLVHEAELREFEKMRYAIVAGLVLSGCAMDGGGMDQRGQVAEPAAATASLRNAAGRQTAQATAIQSGDSIRVRLEASGMPPGSYGAHVHTTGRCDPPDFATAGPHWNPTGQQHGKNNPQGMHKGDLPNLLVGTDGRGSIEITVPAASLRSGAMPMLDQDGAAIVVHERADDFRTDPSGNSGARIACGVFG
jgi:Cu-Zn family superoxide dismutase